MTRLCELKRRAVLLWIARPAFLYCLAMLLLSTALPKLAFSGAGDLDPSFGPGGTVTTDLGSQEYVAGFAVQHAGHIVLLGSSELFPGAFALARYLPNGRLDKSFGLEGIIVTDLFGDDLASPRAIAVQPDGKIVAVGIIVGQGAEYFERLALVRYNGNGSLDPGFGDGGKVITRFGQNYVGANSVALQDDGKIVAAGYCHGDEFPSFALVRYLRNGTIDRGFGRNGRVRIRFFSEDQVQEIANAVAIQHDGRIVVAGWASQDRATADCVGTVGVFALARLRSNGELDPSFGNGGKVRTDFSKTDDCRYSFDTATSLAIQPDGRIILAGHGTHGENVPDDFVIIRYRTDGQIDRGFGSHGKVITDFFGNHDRLGGITLQPDGKLLTVGSAQVTLGALEYDFALARYTRNGEIDPSFGMDGKVTTRFFGHDEAVGIALQKNGKIIAAGTAHIPWTPIRDFALSRYLSR